MRRYSLGVLLMVIALIAAPRLFGASADEVLNLFGHGLDVFKKAGEAIDVWIRLKRTIRSDLERSQLENLSRELTRLSDTKCRLVRSLRRHASTRSQASWEAVSTEVPPILDAVTASASRVSNLRGSFTAQEAPTWNSLLDVLQQKRYGVLLVLLGRDRSPLDSADATRIASKLDEEVATIRTATASLGDYLKRTAPGAAGTETAGTHADQPAADKHCAKE